MPRFEIIAGLDVGTTKVCLAAARKQHGQSQAEFLDFAVLECEALRSNGTIADLSKVADAIGAALDRVQDKTRQRISTAFVNIMGAHVISENVRGKVNVLSRENEISKKDLDMVYQNARVSAVTYDREPLLVAPQDFIVDGQGGIKDPLGLFGSKLEVDYLFVTGSTPAIGNLCRAVNMGGLEVEELVLSNLAAGFSVLDQPEKELGVILIDIGGSICEVTIFTDGLLRYDKMLACGARDLAGAIGVELKVQPEIADKILKNYCKVWLPNVQRPDEEILIKEVSPPRAETTGRLQKIIEPKIKEILDKIKGAIQESDYAPMASSGVVLTGGISAMDGLAEMAEAVFNMPTRVGMEKNTAAGLIHYGCQKRNDGKSRRSTPSGNMLKRTFQTAKDFIYDYF